jgi:predicted AlkP superfamily pyrophosphatase or phosphodiesterase
MAKAAVNGEQLGSDSLTDLLAISLSTPDYVGHTFGPNSVEQEDNFLRLDKEIGDFLRFLDTQVGNGKYVVFVSADHGAPQVPAFLKDHKIPAGNLNEQAMADHLNELLKSKYKNDKLVIGIFHNQVYLDRSGIASSRVDKGQMYNIIIDFLLQQPGISRAFALDQLNNVTLSASIKNIIANGYYPLRSGDIQIISDPQWIEEFQSGGTTHGVWNPYDSHIPLLWYGWNIPAGKTHRKVFMTDIAPTIAAMLHIQMPNGSIGDVIEEVLK